MSMFTLDFTLNGQHIRENIPSDLILIDYLRKYRKLTGTKKACGTGECGACTVLINGRAIYSCITLAIHAHGKSIETIEGLSDGETLHPIQDAFLEAGAVQCGYCTPGMILSAKALLMKKPRPDDSCVRQAMAGNICRCTGYKQILDAVRIASETMSEVAEV